MEKNENLPIFKKAYQLSRQILDSTRSFPKAQRFLMAARLEEASISLLENIFQANEAARKVPYLNETSRLLERLRILIRLSKDSAYINFKRYESLSRAADEVGRMLGGWIKYSAVKEKGLEEFL
jgi:four helix bundle protein